jgi:hypothetical protein
MKSQDGLAKVLYASASVSVAKFDRQINQNSYSSELEYKAVEIHKPASCYTLPHSFAAHSLQVEYESVPNRNCSGTKMFLLQ